jgi:hypothetical protein
MRERKINAMYLNLQKEMKNAKERISETLTEMEVVEKPEAKEVTWQ